MGRTDHFFKPGRLTTLMDGGAGSSGKGKMGAFLAQHADNNLTFVCNTFAPQAGHWVRNDDGSEYFYQTLNSCAHLNKYDIFIGPGAIIEVRALLREMEATGMSPSRLHISPIAGVLQDFDADFERGKCSLDGYTLTSADDRMVHEGTAKFGSTCHGVGAATARKLLRRPNMLLARDVPELREFIHPDIRSAIIDRLTSGQAGLLEVAQGYQLSLNHQKFYPFCTSRNVTVAQGLSDMMLPTRLAGPVVLNFRTFPIRIHSCKYIDKDGNHLTWDEVQAGKPHTVMHCDSGPWYEDQHEITWEQVTAESEAKTPLMEMTSVTKLPRRVATFSPLNVRDAIMANDTGDDMHLSLNFINYVDASVTGVRDMVSIGGKVCAWLEDHLGPWIDSSVKRERIRLSLLGTGALTDDTVIL